MKIEKTCINSYDKTNYNRPKAPSFQAIHPANYYIKDVNGQCHKVTNKDTIQYLQKKIISWLNKTLNDYKRSIEGNPRKVNPKESQQDKNLRNCLEKFFAENDKDYAVRKEAKSIYIDYGDSFYPYIITGKTTDLASHGKPIGKAHKQLNESREYVQTYYGLGAKDAEQYVSPAVKRLLAQAKENYHKENLALVHKLMAQKDTDKATVNFCFTTIPESKKVRPKYQLENVKWQKSML
jgi:hypothetical protein